MWSLLRHRSCCHLETISSCLSSHHGDRSKPDLFKNMFRVVIIFFKCKLNKKKKKVYVVKHTVHSIFKSLTCVVRSGADNSTNVSCVFYGGQVSVGLSAVTLSAGPAQWCTHKVVLTGLGEGNTKRCS